LNILSNILLYKMKNLLKLSIFLLLFSTVSLQSQTFSFERTSPEIVYGAPDTTAELVSYGHIINTGSSPISIRLVRTINNHSAHWESSICDINNCYSPDTDTATAIYPVGTHEISVHYYIDTATSHAPGIGTVIIRAENVSNPSENYSVTFIGSTYPVSIKQLSEVVEGFKLNQNYPNPFNPTTKIGFAIPKAGYVDLRVYDILGREVKVLLSQQLNTGEYEIEFDAKNLASGMYYYRLQTNDNVSVKKMTLVK